MSRTRILCLGDLHLGLPPSRLPPDADPRRTSTATVWLRAVDTAIREQASLVLLSGDVIDRDNRYFEAFGPLEEGLARLADAGIEVCAVAGNHDADVLEPLRRVLSTGRLRLLGGGGEWERFTLEDDAGRPVLHVDGWSFPARDVREDPTASHDLPRPDDDAPVLGMVHGDLGRPRSTNAPLSRDGLARPEVDAWVLGHLHKPERIDLAGGRWALYPGSPQPLDPTETGVHGAWWVDVEAGRLSEPHPVALATVRYERVEVDLTGTETVEDVRAALVRRVTEAVSALELAGDPDWLVLRAELTGRTGAHGELKSLARRLEGEEPLEPPTGSGRARLTEVLIRTRPSIDLREHAGVDDPVGVLADLLLALEPETVEDAERTVDPDLLRRVRRREREAYEFSAFSGLSTGGQREEAPADDSEERPRRRLARVTASLLDALLETKGSRPRAEGADEP